MSITNGNHKVHILVSYKMPEDLEMPHECELDRNIKMTIASALKEKYPDLTFVLTDDECHGGKLPDGFDLY